MSDAAEIVRRIGDELSDIDRVIRGHPFPDLLMRKELPVSALRAFVGNQYAIITSDLRSVAMLVHRFGQPPSRDFLMGVLDGERKALDGLLVMARKLGMTEQDLVTYDVSPAAFAYTAFMAWQALYASAAEFVMGILLNFAAWGHNCGRMSAALRERHGFTEADTAFLDGFAGMPPLDEPALAIIQHGLDRGVTPAELRRGARLFQAYEKMFWDAMVQGAAV
jgi:thiaminase